MPEENVNKPQQLTVIFDEEAAVVVAVTLGQRYPNLIFGGYENGAGGYDITVKSKYQNHTLSEHLLTTVRNDAYVAGIAYRVVKAIKPGVNETAEDLAQRLSHP